MKTKASTSIAAVVVALHLAALSFVASPWHWKYLLVTVVSGALIWGVWSAPMRRRQWGGLFVGVIAALAVQQIAFRFWRTHFAGPALPLVQFTALHLLIGLGFDRLRRPGPSLNSDDTRRDGPH